MNLLLLDVGESYTVMIKVPKVKQKGEHSSSSSSRRENHRTHNTSSTSKTLAGDQHLEGGAL